MVYYWTVAILLTFSVYGLYMESLELILERLGDSVTGSTTFIRENNRYTLALDSTFSGIEYIVISEETKIQLLFTEKTLQRWYYN